MNVLNCIKPLIFGACIELRLSFGSSNVLHCKNPLIFGACVQLCFSFRTADVLHVENLILWFSIADELHCKRPLIFGACGELPLLFGTTDVLLCKKLLYLALICFELRLSFRTAHELHCETLFIFGALCSITSFVCHVWCGAMKNVLCLAFVLQYLFYLSLSMCWLVKHLFYLALVLICIIYFALCMCAAIPRKCFTSKLTYQLRNDLNLQNVGSESLFIETPTSSGKPFIIGVIYRHPAHAFPPFQDEFIKLVTHLQNKNCEYLIGGDFNCNLLKYHE